MRVLHRSHGSAGVSRKSAALVAASVGDLGATIDVPKLPERLPKPLEAGDRDQLPRHCPTTRCPSSATGR